jgi:hypothetical protein
LVGLRFSTGVGPLGSARAEGVLHFERGTSRNRAQNEMQINEVIRKSFASLWVFQGALLLRGEVKDER